MNCFNCRRTISSDSIYCKFCGKRQTNINRKPIKRHSNGCGSAYKRGKSWYASVTKLSEKQPDGTWKQLKERKGGFKTEAEARAYIPILLAKIETIKNPPKTFERVFLEWLSTREEKISKKTLDGYKYAWAHFNTLNEVSIDKIAASDLQKCIYNCEAGKRTKQLMKVVAGQVFKYAMDHDYVNKNRSSNLSTGDERVGTYSPITETELNKIHDVIGKIQYADYLYCLCYLGFRPTEFFGLMKSDYHNDNGIEYLVAGIKTEAGMNRSVTISSKISSIIKYRLSVSNTDLLFPRYDYNRKGEFAGFSQMTGEYFRKMIFHPMMKTLGISGKVPYSSRHTFANKIKNASGSDKDKAALMGHSDYSTTRKYYQSSCIEDKRRITDSI